MCQGSKTKQDSGNRLVRARDQCLVEFRWSPAGNLSLIRFSGPDSAAKRGILKLRVLAGDWMI